MKHLKSAPLLLDQLRGAFKDAEPYNELSPAKAKGWDIVVCRMDDFIEPSIIGQKYIPQKYTWVA